MLASAIGNVVFRVVSVDVNKDGVWNPADQGLFDQHLMVWAASQSKQDLALQILDGHMIDSVAARRTAQAGTGELPMRGELLVIKGESPIPLERERPCICIFL